MFRYYSACSTREIHLFELTFPMNMAPLSDLGWTHLQCVRGCRSVSFSSPSRKASIIHDQRLQLPQHLEPAASSPSRFNLAADVFPWKPIWKVNKCKWLSSSHEHPEAELLKVTLRWSGNSAFNISLPPGCTHCQWGVVLKSSKNKCTTLHLHTRTHTHTLAHTLTRSLGCKSLCFSFEGGK